MAGLPADTWDGMAAEITEGTNLLLGRDWTADDVLNKALVEGMRIVGIDFRDGILFVPEVLLAANAMKGGMGILRPLLAETGAKPIGKRRSKNEPARLDADHGIHFFPGVVIAEHVH